MTRYKNQLSSIVIITLILSDITKQNDIFEHKSNKSLGKCVDSYCKCFIHCFDDNIDTNPIEISLNCYSIKSYKQIENSIGLVQKSNLFCNHNNDIIIKSLNIHKSDSTSTIELIKILNKTIECLNISETLTGQLPDNLFGHLINLKHLNISNNSLTNFDSNGLLSPNNRLLTLDLSHNQLTSIDLINLNDLETLSIGNNQLNTLREFDLFKNNKLKHIFLENNDWNCDSHLIWLLNYLKNKPNIVPLNRDKIKCQNPLKVKSMSFDQRLSVWETPICNQCECNLLRSNDSMFVNCSDTHMNHFPSKLPSITKIVRLENNNITNISITSPNDWRNVSYLILNNNTIESFVGLEGTKLLKSLVALHMSHNKLREIPVYVLPQLSHLDELYLSENPWHCDCTAVIFQAWLQRYFKIVKDVYNIRCAAEYSGDDIKPRNGLYSAHIRNRFSNKILLKIPKSELCPQPNEPIDMIEVINWSLAALILLIIFKLIYDYFWQKRTGKLPQFFKININ